MRPFRTRVQLPRRALQVLAAAALIPIVVAGCGGDGVTGPVADGTGKVTAAGAVSLSGSGMAVQQSVTQGGMSVFQIVIVPPTATNQNGWQVQIASFEGRPAVGTHQLLELGADAVTATLYHTSNGSTRMFNSTSGELTITSSSASVVKGTYSFTAADVQGSGTVQVQGTFAARCAPGASCL